jgi:hypothetical protein
LAPAAEWRDWVVPLGERPRRRDPAQSLTAKALRSTRSTWAELLKRVSEIDVLTCPHCGGERKLHSADHRRPARAQDPRAPGAPDRATHPRTGSLTARSHARLVTADGSEPARTHSRERRDGRCLP